jgi:hypothetical protein
VLFEFSINDQLVTKPQTYYAEFVRDALVRGDIAARWAAYQIAVLDRHLHPQRGPRAREQAEAARARHAARPGAPDRQAAGAGGGGTKARRIRRRKAQAIAVESAARLLRKEIARSEARP